MSASGYIEMSASSFFFRGFPAEDATDDGLRFGVLYDE